MGKDVWPNFLIAGAGKSGTTSLHAYLCQHPQVFLPEIKEPNYFAYPEVRYAAAKTEAEYLDLFRACGECKAVGEASVYYFFVPQASRRIHDVLGDRVKLIFILRNPVDMMFSTWAHCHRAGWEPRGMTESLLTSLPDEPFTDATWEKDEHINMHSRKAHFAEQLKRYLNIFPHENIKVFIFEEFFAPGLPLYGELLNFLGVSQASPPDSSMHNKGYGVRSHRLARFLNVQYPERIYPVIKNIVPHRLRKAIKNILLHANQREIDSLDMEMRSILEERMAPGVRELEGMIGRDLSRLWF